MQASDAAEQPNRIQVVVRVRPVLPHELSDEVSVTCSQDARRLQVLLPDRLTGGANVLPGATRSGARSYEFDACLPGNTTQEELYDTCGLQELVEAALDGYCVTVFAFGQTGSGKTHTIIGPRLSRGAAAAAAAGGGGGGSAGSGVTGRLGAGDDLLTAPPPGSAASARSTGSAASPAVGGASGGAGAAGTGGGGSCGITIDPEDGILTRCIAAAYRSMEARSGGAEFSVTASVVELYNEAVTDLLALDKTRPLQIRKDSRDGFAVTGLTQVSCPTDVSAVRYMVRALQYRHTRGHKLNEYSSRSHCLMTFVFASSETGPGGQTGAKGGIRRYGKLALVDLAGSERLKDTGNTEKGAVRETGAINKSLFTLGQVLAALSARSCGAPATFVPFRDSKLTQLLWDGLRGSGRCLMLACLGPMRGAAEESLNTLHFATMATRIKAEPVVLLDPQDQLVLDLRKTITQLREENRQLAGALQQLSTGADASAVLAALPEAIRAHAGNGVVGGGGGGGSGTTTPTLPDDPGAPETPQRQQNLQPLPGPGSGRGRQPFEGAVTEATAAVGGGGGFSSGIPLPPGLQQRNGSGGGSAAALPFRTSYDSSQGGYGQPRQLQQQYMSYPQQYQRGPMGQSTDVDSPKYSPVINRNRSKPKGGGAAAGRRQSPAHAAYVQGRKPGAAGGKGGSPRDGRAKSVGRGRPTYLTEDPGALLFGYSRALQPPQPPGSGNSSAMSLPALVPNRGSAAVAPPPPALSDFPELAAMEAEFQNLLANGFGGVAAAKRGPPPSSGSGGGGGDGCGRSSGGNGGAAAATSGGGGGTGAEAEDPDGPRPDVRALKWADRNTWFGTDYDMTAYAYQVHDQLVEAEGVDPTSDLYYTEIERRVAEKFPERWLRVMKDQVPGGSGAAAAAAVRRAAACSPGHGHTGGGEPPARSSPLQSPTISSSYSNALRVNVKEPLFRSGGSGGNSREMAASLAAQAAAARSRQQPPPSGAVGSYDSGSYDPYREPNGGGGSQPVTPLYGVPDSGSTSGPDTPPLNPFNIGALHSAAPPKAVPPRGPTHGPSALGPGPGQGFILVPAGAESPGRGGYPAEMFTDPSAVERIQREYARQRQLVVEELRKAKEDAEAERQRILARIQRVAGGNKWR